MTEKTRIRVFVGISGCLRVSPGVSGCLRVFHSLPLILILTISSVDRDEREFWLCDGAQKSSDIARYQPCRSSDFRHVAVFLWHVLVGFGRVSLARCWSLLLGINRAIDISIKNSLIKL